MGSCNHGKPYLPSPIPPGILTRPIPVSEIDSATLALYIPQKLSAGFPPPAADYVEQKLDCNRYLVDRVASTFIFDVKGWSMKLAGIFDRNKVLVDRSIPPQHGHIIVAIVNDEFTIKRLVLNGNSYELHPENPDFQPIRFKEGEALQVFGVVISQMRRML